MARLERLLEDMQRQLQNSQVENARLQGELAQLTHAPPAQRVGEGPGPMDYVNTASGGVGNKNGLQPHDTGGGGPGAPGGGPRGDVELYGVEC